MAIDSTTLNALLTEGQAACEAGAGNILSAIRPHFPGLTITQCPSSDVTETPFQTGSHFDVHLVDTRNHCWALTDSADDATAVLLAMHGRPS